MPVPFGWRPGVAPVVAKETHYVYRDSAGTPVLRVTRWDWNEGKAFAQSKWTADGWVFGGVKDAPPYRLRECRDALSRGELLYVVEGEKCAEAVAALGLAATCCPNGAGRWRDEHRDLLLEGLNSDRACVAVLADNDPQGDAHARAVAASFVRGGVANVRVVGFPHLSAKGDVADFLVAVPQEERRQRLVAFVDAVPSLPTHETPPVTGRTYTRVTRVADVTPLRVQWLWQSRIPLGMITIFDGDPGLGKTTVMLDLAARLSRGDRMPDGSLGPDPATVIFESAEDDVARVIRPRLEVAGADLDRIVTVQLETQPGELVNPLICSEDLAPLEEKIQDLKAKLLIMDPLVAFLPDDVNANRDQEVRRALARLRALAERTGAAVVGVRHLNKSGGGNPLYRGGGSIGIIGAARAGLLLAADPDDDSGLGRVLATTKSNLAPAPPGLRLRLDAASGDEHPRVVWQGPTRHSAATLLAVPTDPEERSAIDEARDFLRDRLADGPIPATRIKAEARSVGISERTLFRSKSAEKIQAKFHAHERHWVWQLTADCHDEVETARPYAVGNLEASRGGNALCEATYERDGQSPESGSLGDAPDQPSLSGDV